MKDKLQFPFKRKGGNYLELLEDLGKDTMLGVKTVRATTRNTAIYFDDDGYTIQDAKKLASAIQDTYSDVTATADFGRNPYGEEVPFVFVDKVNSFTRESKMKKLNITKEAFQKSQYFTEKYGKLEYVSESGRLFKTNKGKVLKFKESISDRHMYKIFLKDSEGHQSTVHAYGYDEDDAIENAIDSGKIDKTDEIIKTVDLGGNRSFWTENKKKTNESTFVGDAEAILDKAYATACDELESLGIEYDSSGDNTIFFNDPVAKKTYVFSFDMHECDEYEGESTKRVDEAIPKTLREIPKEQAEKLIQKHLRAGTGEWDGSPGYSDFVYEIGGGRYKLIRPGFGGRYETGVVSM